MTTANPNANGTSNANATGDVAGPLALLPDFFERYFAFFRPGHQEGVVPSRIKELARLKIAALNDCDT